MAELSQPFDLVKELFALIKELRAENSALVGLLVQKTGLALEERVEEIPEGLVSVGKEPWYLKQKRLERHFRKSKLSEIAGISEETEKVKEQTQ